VPATGDALFSTRWIHVFEEDTGGGAVFRPDSEDIPLSRRPREQLELAEDGSARLFVGGPDDRLRPREGHWHKEGDTVVVRIPTTDQRGERELRIVSRSPNRLVVQL
jgi:hypothetical protein